MTTHIPGDELTVTTPTEKSLRVVRRFAALRPRVFDAFTTEEIVQRWLWGPEPWRLAECSIAPHPGGSIRYVWQHPEQGAIGLTGRFEAFDEPARTVHTELFDADWTGGETRVTTEWQQEGAETSVATTVEYSSAEARDRALAVGMVEGMRLSYDRLDALLAE